MIPILIYSLVYLLLFLLTDFMHLKQGYSAEFTRKIVHIVSGITSLTFPFYLENVIQVIILCGGFIGILMISEKMNWFPSITGVKRKSWGSWLFPLAIITCFFCMNYFDREAFFFVPMAILTVSDTMANLVGKKLPFGRFKIRSHQKTLTGSLAFFVSSMVVLFIASSGFSITDKLIIVTAITFVEAISMKGIDNISIPICSIGMLYLFTI